MKFLKKKLAKALSSVSYRQEPARLERLEPRILLSADPILVPSLATSDTERVVAQAKLDIDLAALQRQVRGEDSQAIRLDKDGAGAGQIAQLVAASGDTLQINEQLAELTFVLGDGNNQAMLTQQDDGFFKLSGDSDMFSVLFKAPTGSLTISGGDGTDTITLNGGDLGTADLVVDGESITLAANSTLETLGDVSLLAADQFSGAINSENDGHSLSAAVDISGSLLAGGAVRVGATTQFDFSQTAEDAAGNQALATLGTFDLSASSSITVAGTAKIDADSLQLSAVTDNSLSLSSQPSALNFAVNVAQSALVDVAGGAELSTTATDAAPALVLEAVDRAALAVALTADDAAVPAGTTMLKDIQHQLAVDRSALVRVGDTTGAETVLSAAGAGQVLAYSATLGDVSQVLTSQRTGVATATIQETAQTVLQGVTLTGGQADVMAGAHSDYQTVAKQATQTLVGDVIAQVLDGSVGLEGALRVLATDTTGMESQGTAWVLGGLEMPGGALPALMAVNRMDRSVEASVSSTDVTAADVLIIAHAAAVLQAETAGLTVSAEENGLTQFKLLGALAVNEVLGAVRASATDASLLTTQSSEGDIWVQATQALEARATGEGAMAQGAQQGDGLAGAQVASNLVGWTIPSLDLSALDGWLTFDPANDATMQVEAEVKGTLVQAGRDVVVSARDLSQLASELANTPAAAGAAALALGASQVLSTNRSRIQTSASARYEAGVDEPFTQIMGAGRDFMLRAQQSSALSADVSMSRGLSGSDDSVPAVGGVTAFNVVEHGAKTTLDDVFLVVDGNVALAAEEQSEVRAETRGDLRLVAVNDVDAVLASSSAARDAAVVHNFFTGDVETVAEDSDILSKGMVSLLAANDAQFHAEHRMEGASDSSADAVVAANTLGWRDVPLLDFGTDDWMGASDQSAALQVSATLTNNTLEAGDDLEVLSRFAVDSFAGAAVEGREALMAGHLGLLFVGNLIDADVGSVLQQAAHELYTIGGDALVSARQDATVRALADTGRAPASVSAYFVRNVLDVPVAVAITAISLETAGDLSVRAEDRALVTAEAQGELQTPAPALDDSAALADALLGAVMVVNSGLPQALVVADGGNLTAGGAMVLEALEALDVTAHNQVRQQGGDRAVGSTEAWNVFGWAAPEVGRVSVANALVGDFVSAPVATAGAEVRWLGEALAAGGALTVVAQGQSSYDAVVDALPLASLASEDAVAQQASLAIANSSVSARHRVLLGPSATAPGSTDALSDASITSGADLHLGASDGVQMNALVAFSTEEKLNRLDTAVAQTLVDGDTEVSLGSTVVDSTGDLRISAEAWRTQSSQLQGAVQWMDSARTLRDAPAGARATNLAGGDVLIDLAGSTLAAGGDVALHASAANQATAYQDLEIKVDDSEAPINDDDPADLSLAANVIGMQAGDRASLGTLLDTALEASNAAEVSVRLSNSDIDAVGSVDLAAGRVGDSDPEEFLRARIGSDDASERTLSPPGFLLATNLINRDVVVDLQGGLGGTSRSTLAAGDAVRVAATVAADIAADVELNKAGNVGATSAGAAARNVVRQALNATLEAWDGAASGDLTVEATDSSALQTTMDGAIRTAQVFANGDFALAEYGLISANHLMGEIVAQVLDSSLSTGGDLNVLATAQRQVNAEHTAVLGPDGLGIGGTLAYNTLGWSVADILRAQNADNLVFSNLVAGGEADILAQVLRSTTTVGGQMTVDAAITSELNASMSNASATDVRGGSSGAVVSTNLIRSQAQALVQPDAGNTVDVIGDLRVTATDARLINAEIFLSGETTGGASFEYAPVDHNSSDGVQTLSFGDQVMVDPRHTEGGSPGLIYRYMGGDDLTADLAELNYEDTGLWYEIAKPSGVLDQLVGALAGLGGPTWTFLWDTMVDLADEIINLFEGDGAIAGALAVGGLTVRNDVRGGARAEILNASVEAGSVTVKADESAIIDASIDAVAQAAGSLLDLSFVSNRTVAANQVNSSSVARIHASVVDATAGDVIVHALNDAWINAEVAAQITADFVSLGETLAFNTIGWDPYSVMSGNLLERLTGAVGGKAVPVETSAAITDATVDAMGTVDVTADSQAVIQSEVGNEVESEASIFAIINTILGLIGIDVSLPDGIALGMTVATNLVTTDVKATLGGSLANAVNVNSGGLIVEALDAAVISSNADMTAASFGGDSELILLFDSIMARLGVSYTDHSGRQQVGFMSRVRLAEADYKSYEYVAELQAGDRVELTDALDGQSAGSTFEYIGEDQEGPLALDEQAYSDETLWREVKGDAGATYVYIGASKLADLATEDYEAGSWVKFDFELITTILSNILSGATLGDSNAPGFGGLIVRNEIAMNVLATASHAALSVAGDTRVRVDQLGYIASRDQSEVSAGAGALNLVVANNTIMGQALADFSSNSLVATATETADGDLLVEAVNRTRIIADVESSVEADTSVGVTLAFNSIGHDPVSLLDDAEAVAKANSAPEQRMAIEARVTNVDLDLAGAFDVNALGKGSILAIISGSALSVGVATRADEEPLEKQERALNISIAPVIAINRIGMDVLATVEVAENLALDNGMAVKALGQTAIEAEIASSSVAIAAAPRGGMSASLSFTMANNDIDSVVRARVGSVDTNRPTVTTAGGPIIVQAERTGRIEVDGMATAVGVAASQEGSAFSLAGGATLSRNQVVGETEAVVDAVNLTSTGAQGGDIRVSADDTTGIDAKVRTVAASVALGAGASAAAAALGFTYSQNIIGMRHDSDGNITGNFRRTSDHQTELVTKLTQGEYVLVDTGPGPDLMYEYVGETIDFVALAEEEKEARAEQDERVEEEGDDDTPVYFDENEPDPGVMLPDQNFRDESTWRLLGVQEVPTGARARVLNSEITTAGTLDVNASASAEIRSVVFTSTGAIAASSKGAAAVSGSGAYAENRISADTRAEMLGSSTGAELSAAERPKVEAGSIKVEAVGRNSIQAGAGAGALGAAFGGGTGVGVALGLSLAYNEIRSDVLANVAQVDATARDGDVVVRADNGALEGAASDPFDVSGLAGERSISDFMDGLSKTFDAVTYQSDKGTGYDVVQGPGLAFVADDDEPDRILMKDGKIYEFTLGTGEKYLIDLETGLLSSQYLISAANDFDDLWDEVDIEESELKPGYSVRVAGGHTAGGTPGAVYRFIGLVEDHNTDVFETEVVTEVTEDGEEVEVVQARMWITPEVPRFDSNGEPITNILGQQKTRPTLVRVGPKHEQADALLGKVFEYTGTRSYFETDPLSIDFLDGPWEEVSDSEDIALSLEDFSNTERWALATDIATEDEFEAFRDLLIAKGLDLAGDGALTQEASFRSVNVTPFDLTFEDSYYDLSEGDRVLDPETGVVFKLLLGGGDAFDLTDEQEDLSEVDGWWFFTKTDLQRVPLSTLPSTEYNFDNETYWRPVAVSANHQVNLDTVALSPGQVVVVDSGEDAGTYLVTQAIDFRADMVGAASEGALAPVVVHDQKTGEGLVVENGELLRSFTEDGTAQFFRWNGAEALELAADEVVDFSDANWQSLSSVQAVAPALANLQKGDIVTVKRGGAPFSYMYKGDGETLNLRSEPWVFPTLSDDEDEAIKINNDRWLYVPIVGIEVERGQIVSVDEAHSAGGTPGASYRYIAGESETIDLENEDYGDESRWERVVPSISIQTIEAGRMWSISAESGETYHAILTADGLLKLEKPSITATSVAASLAAGIGLGGAGVAVAGAGAFSDNRVLGDTAALVDRSALQASGDASVLATSAAGISAKVIASSLAIAGGSSAGVGAALGASVARNTIGEQDESGATSGVTARVTESTLDLGGSLSVLATGSQQIFAVTVAAAGAVVAGGVGASGAGTGASAINAIGANIEAAIDNSDATAALSLAAGDVIVRADDQSMIKSHAGAGAVALALGFGVGVSVALGVTLAENTIVGDISARMTGVDLDSAGDVTVAALSQKWIDAIGWAAAAALAGGSAAGVGLAGAGVSVTNRLAGDTQALVDDSVLVALGSIDVLAQAKNLIEAKTVAAALGVGLGGTAGVAGAMGRAKVHNYIGFNPKAYAGAVTFDQDVTPIPEVIRTGDIVRLSSQAGAYAGQVYEYIGEEAIEGYRTDSGFLGLGSETKEEKDDDEDLIIDSSLAVQDYGNASLWRLLGANEDALVTAAVQGSDMSAGSEGIVGDINVRALNDNLIDSSVFAGSVALSGAGGFALSISGSGATAANYSRVNVRAAVRDAPTGVTATGDLSILADDVSQIDSYVGAVSVAVSLALVSAAAAIGSASTDNVIAGTIEAELLRSDVSAGGDVSVLAQAGVIADSVTTASAVAVGTIAMAMGGAASQANMGLNVLATIDGDRTADGAEQAVIEAGGDIVLDADADVEALSEIQAAAAAFGVSASAAAGVFTQNISTGLIRSRANQATFLAEGAMRIGANAYLDARGEAAALVVSSGMSAGGATALTTFAMDAIAELGDSSIVRAGALAIEARSDSSVQQQTRTPAAGAIAAARAKSVLNLLGDARANMGNDNEIEVGALDVRADLRLSGDSYLTMRVAGALAAVSGEDTSAFLGQAAVKIGSDNSVQATDAIRIKATSYNAKDTFAPDGYSFEARTGGAFAQLGVESKNFFGLANDLNGAQIDIATGTTMLLDNGGTSGGVFEVGARHDVFLRGRMLARAAAAAGYLNVDAALVNLSEATVDLDGASLENRSGTLLVNTQTGGRLTNEVTSRLFGAVVGGDTQNTSIFNSDNSITLNNASVQGRRVQILAGGTPSGETPATFANAITDVITVGIAAVGTAQNDVRVRERSAVDVLGSSALAAAGNIDLRAQSWSDGKDGDAFKRASSGGVNTNLAAVVPFVKQTSGDEDTVVLTPVTVAETATITAGKGGDVQLRILPYLVDGKQEVAFERMGEALTDEEKQSLGIDPSLSYEYRALEFDSVAIAVTDGTLVRAKTGAFQTGENNALYQFTPEVAGTERFILDQVSYEEDGTWVKVAPKFTLDGTARELTVSRGDLVYDQNTDTYYQMLLSDHTFDSGSEVFDSTNGWRELSVIDSDAGLSYANQLSDDFYVVKPTDVGMPTLRLSNAGGELLADRQRVLGWIANHQGNTEALARYQSLLDEINRELESQGYLKVVNGIEVVQSGGDQLVLELPEIEASSGLVVVQGDWVPRATMEGISANPTARIDVLNATPLSMEVQRLAIAGGDRLEVINGELVTLKPGSVYINGQKQGEGNPALVSEISIVQDAYPDEFYFLGTGVTLPPGPQELNIRGTITNESGAVLLKNLEGSVNVRGEVRAASLDIAAAGSFNLVSDNWFHSGGDPRALAGSAAERAASLSAFAGDKTEAFREVALTSAPPESTIFALGSVTINARYLNLNGVIQSGVDNYEVTFDTGFNPGRSSNFTGTDGQVLPGITFGADGLQTVDGFFDADTGTIILNDITPQGGRVSLTGTIVSTGGGEIRVASGYPSVKITNLTNFDLALGEIKADENRVGEIIITDTSSLRREKYTVFDGSMTRVIEQGELTSDGELNSISYEEVLRVDGLFIDGVHKYQPEEGRFYGWVEGLGIAEIKTEIFEDRAFWGADWLAGDRASADTKITPTDERPLLESEFVLSAEETRALFPFDYDGTAENAFLQKYQ